MDGQIVVYYALPSLYCRSVMMLAKALDMKLNLKPVDLMKGETMSPKFLEMNPQHCVPTFVESDFILWESRAIMQYLIDKFDKNKTYTPSDSKEAAMVNQRLYFDALMLGSRLGDYFFPVIAHGEKADVSKKIKYEEALGLLDGFLNGSKWVAGEKITIADFAIVANIATAEAVGIDMSTYPNIANWFERTKAYLADFGYEEINQAGANILGKLFKEKM